MEKLRSKEFNGETFLNMFSNALGSDGEYDRDLQVYQELYDFQKDISFPRSSSILDPGFYSKYIKVAQALRKLGCVFCNHKEYHKSKELYSKALPVYRNHYGFLHKEVNAIVADLYKIDTALRISSIKNIFSLSVNYTSLQSTTRDRKLASVRNYVLEYVVQRRDKYVRLCKGKDRGRHGWHYIFIDTDKIDMFAEECKRSGPIELADFGISLSSGWGKEPSQIERDKYANFGDVMCNGLFLFINRERNAEALYYVLIDTNKKEDIVLEKFYTGSIDDIEYYGKILHYGLGEDPPEVVSDKMILSYFGVGNECNSVERNIEKNLSDLHDVARSGEVETLSYFIDHRVDINGADKNGWISLHHAAYGGNFNAVKYLIGNGAKVHATDTICGRKPVHIAARECHTSIIELFLSEGIGINDADKNDWTSLHYAAWGGNLVTVKFLVNLNADIHAKDLVCGGKPIHIAAKRGHTNILDFFLRKGMDIESADRDGRTSLYYAAKYGHLETVVFLSDGGASVNSGNIYGVKPLHAAAGTGRDVTEYLIRKGTDVNATDKSGLTPLHWAAEYDLETMEFLLAEGADVNAIDKNGGTPLHWAADEGNLEAMDMLIANGADVNAKRNNGDTPFNVAEKMTKRQVPKMNLAARFDMNNVFTKRNTEFTIFCGLED